VGRLWLTVGESVGGLVLRVVGGINQVITDQYPKQMLRISGSNYQCIRIVCP